MLSYLVQRLASTILVMTLVGTALYLFWLLPHYWSTEAYGGRDFNSIERLLTQARVLVMYLGQIVEEADVLTLFDHPCHPYTEGLMRSIPRMEGDRTKPLYMIPGTVPLLSQIPTGCRFAPRCAYATERCRQETPQLTPVSDKQSVRCFRAAELAQKEATAQ